ncbi:aspartate kinase [Lacticaseibacillus baoqingensis]|uniref:aspartate kinase n=1 Tax=Lacticaseibacillus baoqingensis TaxID=2486013 RepID=A0ABW4E805_9LACO|nr:aspartate kinase [Lacticaseibacillus baoqingensis]
MKVCKFGGSSMANANQFNKVKAILKADPKRQVVVVSAAGKDPKHPVKLTDLLLRIAASDDDALFAAIIARLAPLKSALHLHYDLEAAVATIKATWDADHDHDYLVSRGEFLTANLLAEYLAWPFLDARDYLKFNGDTFDAAASAAALKTVPTHFIMPGFYGGDLNGKIHLMPRGGSDISGAWLANLLDAELYENWTDVSGILMADPRVVHAPQAITKLTYAELRELTFMGAAVFQADAVQPVRAKGIPTRILNTNAPQDPGTLVERATNLDGPLTGIAGRRHYTVITLKRYQLAAHLEVIQQALAVMKTYHLKVAYMPTSIDTLNLICHGTLEATARHDLAADLVAACAPDDLEIQANIALISTISPRLAKRPAIAGRLLAYLDDNNIPVRLVSQNSGDTNLLIGVASTDYARALNAIYQNFLHTRNAPEPYFGT